MAPKYKITKSAEEDLLEIFAYGNQTWGEQKASNFIKELYDRFDFLAKQPEIGHVREEFHPDFRSFVYDNYVIFYEVKESLIILAVIHQRQDISSKIDNLE